MTGVPVLIQLLRGHPRGLIICFLAEMWERFSYYGMRGLLIFYLTQHFLFDRQDRRRPLRPLHLAGLHLLPLLGGFLADRYLGTRKAVAFGALLLVAGHLTMAVEGSPATQTLTYAERQTYEFQVEGRGEARGAPDRRRRQALRGRRANDGGRLRDQEPAGPVAPCRPCCPRASTSWA